MALINVRRRSFWLLALGPFGLGQAALALRPFSQNFSQMRIN